MGEDRRPETVAVDEEPHPEITLREISAWSLAILAAIAAGFVLYAAREVMLPVVAAFVVGVMLGPAARRLEALHVPRALAALLLVASVTLIVALVILLIFPRVSELANGLPGMVASLKEKLHVFDGLVGAWRRFTSTMGQPPSADAGAIPLPGISWVPSTISILLPPITGFLFFLVVLLLVISEWPGLRRGLVMTFASRDSRLTVLKILNEIESGLANYLLIVTLINLGVGALAGVICALTGIAECSRLRRPGRDTQLRSDHWADRHVRSSPRCWGGGRAYVPAGACPRRGIPCGDHGRGPVLDPDDHRTPP
jgi:predicted PurR-regulated permease PerM